MTTRTTHDTSAAHFAADAPRNLPRLLADVGGTHARFAWQRNADAAPEQVQVLRCAEYATLLDAARAYLATLEPGAMPAPRLGAIGIANPVVGDHVQMTNHHWSFSISALRTALGLERLVVVNDFEALALALPLLEPDETEQLAGGAADPLAPRALIGPGTGLGVAALVHSGRRWQAIAGEGGHVSLSPQTEREAAVMFALQRRFGHASAERAVSGQGLVWLHDALAELDGAIVATTGLDGAEVARRAPHDPRCAEALALFFAFLGTTAGNLALTLGARGGVYFGGGVLPKLARELAASGWRERFVGKGRFRGYLEAVPVHLIVSTRHPPLRGAAQALLA